MVAVESETDEAVQFKQEVVAKLAFLGTPHGDAATLRGLWRFANLSARHPLGRALRPDAQRLVKALARDIGAPRAERFVKWLEEKSQAYFAGCSAALLLEVGSSVTSEAATPTAAESEHSDRIEPLPSSHQAVASVARSAVGSSPVGSQGNIVPSSQENAASAQLFLQTCREPCAQAAISGQALAQSVTCSGNRKELAINGSFVTFSDERGASDLVNSAANEKDRSVNVPVGPKQECPQNVRLPSVQHLATPACPKAPSDFANASHQQKRTPSETTVQEAWVEVKSKGGKVYYWDRRSNSCAWDLPAGTRAKWTRHQTPDGRSYYCDRSGKSFWAMPPLQESASAPTSAKRAHVVARPRKKNSNTTLARLSAPADWIFLPDIGMLQPLLLPPPSETTRSDDLGPFEAALEPETPVLAAAAAKVGAASDAAAAAEPETPVPCALAQSPATVTIVSKVRVAAGSSHAYDDGLAEQRSPCGTDDSDKDAEISQLTSKIEIMSTDSTNLREELARVRRQLASFIEESRPVPWKPQEVTAKLIGFQPEVPKGVRQEDEDNPGKHSKRKRSCTPARRGSMIEASTARPTERSKLSHHDDEPLQRKKPQIGSGAQSNQTDQDGEWESWSHRTHREHLIAKLKQVTLQQQASHETLLHKKICVNILESMRHQEKVACVADTRQSKTSVDPSAIKTPADRPDPSKHQEAETDKVRSGSRERSRSPRREKENAEAKLRSLKAALLERQSAAKSAAERGANVASMPSDPQAGKNVLDKYLTVVRHGVPPGNWGAVESGTTKAEQTTGDETTRDRMRRRKAPAGGA